MTGTFLDKIIEAKRHRVSEAKRLVSRDELFKQASKRESSAGQNRFRNAISDTSRVNIIAEYKRASPSRGTISDRLDPVETAMNYQHAGAAAVSVLTEEDFFRGCLQDLCQIKHHVSIPIIRKDFIIDEYQIVESAAAKADAILLIVAALSRQELIHFHRLGTDLNLDVLVEVHDPKELEIALEAGAELIGVNNRNLKTFEVSLEVSETLIKLIPAEKVAVAESGITGEADIHRLRDVGFSAFLVGETLMRSSDPGADLRKLVGAKASAQAIESKSSSLV